MNFEGIGKVDGMTVFIPGAIKGEKVKAKILKVNSSYAFAKLEQVISSSENRMNLMCEFSNRCGGCIQHISYEETLNIKKDNAIATLNKQHINVDFTNTDIYGMGCPWHYRNKVQYPIRDKEGKAQFGMFALRSHNLIEVKNCLIQNEVLNKIAEQSVKQLNKYGFSGYNENTHKGDVRNMLLRIGYHTEDIMIVFVVNGNNVVKNPNWKEIAKYLVNEFPNIKSIGLNINDNDTNVILSDKNVCIYGGECITDYIGKYKFNINANSFFQVNTIQAEVLYSVLKEKLKLKGNESILDLYSGVGSIGIFLSDSVDEVYGVEIVPEAVQMAKENIKLNNITNAQYIQGDATEEIAKLERRGVKFDVVVVDPPRKGLDMDGIETLKKIHAEKIGYVSCNTATLARDLKLLEDTYNVENVNFVDLFPFTRTFGMCGGVGVKTLNHK